MKTHQYAIKVEWTGNLGVGTTKYDAYERSHQISAPHKITLEASSDPAFRGDATKYNPEELLLASLSSCHMLWFLHLCTVENVVVVDYQDQATGTMVEKADGSGQFTEVTLHPKVVVATPEMQEKVEAIHHKAHEKCFIANSVNFPINLKGDVCFAN